MTEKQPQEITLKGNRFGITYDPIGHTYLQNLKQIADAEKSQDISPREANALREALKKEAGKQRTSSETIVLRTKNLWSIIYDPSIPSHRREIKNSYTYCFNQINDALANNQITKKERKKLLKQLNDPQYKPKSGTPQIRQHVLRAPSTLWSITFDENSGKGEDEQGPHTYCLNQINDAFEKKKITSKEAKSLRTKLDCLDSKYNPSPDSDPNLSTGNCDYF